ncbi:branched-chain amino acid ABC transporter permease [soil metagenome]
MDLDIAAILSIDGLANGSVYLLAGIGLVMVFCVTRVVFMPFGDIAAFAALSMAALEAGRVPASVWLVMTLAVAAAACEGWHLYERGRLHAAPRAVAAWLVLPAIPCLLAWLVAGKTGSPLLNVMTCLALMLPIAPLLARIALQPIADASVLSLFMVSLALHFLLSGLGLIFFGPEGSRTAPLVSGSFSIAGATVSAQAALMIGTSLVLCILFWLLFERTLTGKALRATSVNRVGSRLVGIRPARSSLVAYGGASLLAAAIGLLIAPVVTMYYDSGFVIGLKAFVAATIGGLVSYPLTAAGAVAVGLVESFSSFWTGTLKDVIVFSLLIPALMIRSLFAVQSDGDAEEADA